jgi:hypothetical protein
MRASISASAVIVLARCEAARLRGFPSLAQSGTWLNALRGLSSGRVLVSCIAILAFFGVRVRPREELVNVFLHVRQLPKLLPQAIYNAPLAGLLPLVLCHSPVGYQRLLHIVLACWAPFFCKGAGESGESDSALRFPYGAAKKSLVPAVKTSDAAAGCGCDRAGSVVRGG